MKKILSIGILFAAATLSAQQTDSAKKEIAVPAQPVKEHSFAEKMHERFAKEGLKVYLSNDSSQWLKATMVAQIWLRDNDNNPGSTVFGYGQRETQDAGIRRLRFQLFGQV